MGTLYVNTVPDFVSVIFKLMLGQWPTKKWTQNISPNMMTT